MKTVSIAIFCPTPNCKGAALVGHRTIGANKNETVPEWMTYFKQDIPCRFCGKTTTYTFNDLREIEMENPDKEQV
ncbi:MAG: hypothetical protein ACHQ1H_04920 [Nitrososphaerales archaeon]